MRLLWSLAHGLQSRSKRMEAELGVTGPQRLVIRILGRSPGASAGALARAMCVHPSTLTGVLRRLQARGLVEQRRDNGDARRKLFVLTASGKRLDTLQAGTAEAAVRRALGRVKRTELELVTRALSTVADELARQDR